MAAIARREGEKPRLSSQGQSWKDVLHVTHNLTNDNVAEGDGRGTGSGPSSA